MKTYIHDGFWRMAETLGQSRSPQGDYIERKKLYIAAVFGISSVSVCNVSNNEF